MGSKISLISVVQISWSTSINNYRYYDQGSLDKLSFILNCRSLGISIKDIESLCEELETPNQNCTKVNNLIKKHTKELDNRIKQLTSFKKQLDDLENLCGDNRKIENCYIIKKLEMNSWNSPQFNIMAVIRNWQYVQDSVHLGL